MRNPSFLLHFALLSASVVLFSCKNTKVATPLPEPVPGFRLEASARPYIAALDKGRGVLFYISFIQPDSMNFEQFDLDSLLIHGKVIPSTWKQSGKTPEVEGNYFVPVPDPEPGVIPMPTTDSPDPILYLSDYLPATLYFHYKGRAYSEDIDHFHFISE